MLKEFTMPNPALAKKRERNADIQDDLWNKMGVEPIQLVEDKQTMEKVRRTENQYLIRFNEYRQESEKLNKLQKRLEELSEESTKHELSDKEQQEFMQLKKEIDEKDNLVKIIVDELDKEFEEWQKARKKDESQPKEPGTGHQSKASSPTLAKKSVATIETEDSVEQMAVKKTILFAENILRMGMSYVYEFVGMVSTRLADRDVRSYYAWKEKGSSLAELQSPLEKSNVKTIGDLIGNNMHLGRPICTLIFNQYNKILENEKKLVKIGADSRVTSIRTTQKSPDGSTTATAVIDIDFAEDLQTQGNLLNQFLNGTDISSQTGGYVIDEKKQWVFSILDITAFQQILSAGTFGAMSLAWGQIRRIPGCEKFTMKQLIMSEGVRDVFAIFVAFQYLMSSGGNAYAWRTGSSERGMAKNSNYMVSAGLETRKMLYAQIETAQYWFRDVYEVKNPMKDMNIEGLKEDDLNNFRKNLPDKILQHAN